MIKKLKLSQKIAIILVLALTLSYIPNFIEYNSVLADDEINVDKYEEELNQIENEIKNTNGSVESYKKMADFLLQEMKKIDDEIAELNHDIEVQTELKENAEERLQQAEDDLDRAIAERAEFKKILDDRVAVMYMYGDGGYIDVIFGSTSFTDFISKVQSLSYVIAYDNSVVDKLEKAEAVIKQTQAQIEEEKALIEEALGELIIKQSELEIKAQQKQDRIDEARANENYYLALGAQQEAEANELRKIIAEATGSGEHKNHFDDFAWPTPGYTYITSPFGYRTHPIYGGTRFHYGVDIGASGGSDIVAPGNGEITYSGWYGSYGNCVIMDLGYDANGSRWQMLFAHQQRLIVSVGQQVKRGERIGVVGTTGASTGNHLHFEVIIDSVKYNALDYVTIGNK